MVRVRDTGHGISNPERLFQPFQEGAEATGLGLYLSRALVRTFNGDLRYEPGPPGCCFALDLMPSGTRGTRREDQKRMDKIRILLLDDHALFREGLSRLMESEPDLEMAAHCATVGEATEFLRHKPIDLVLLDYDLGKENGLRVYCASSPDWAFRDDSSWSRQE